MNTKIEQDAAKVWFIAWVSNRTGREGIGKKPMTRELADLWVDILNREDPNVRHWAVKSQAELPKV